MRDERGLLEALLSDGRFLLSITGLVLVLSGGFAIFQSLTGYFRPQDVHALGFDARQGWSSPTRSPHFRLRRAASKSGYVAGRIPHTSRLESAESIGPE
jgi:hypothetical protein